LGEKRNDRDKKSFDGGRGPPPKPGAAKKKNQQLWLKEI